MQGTLGSAAQPSCVTLTPPLTARTPLLRTMTSPIFARKSFSSAADTRVFCVPRIGRKTLGKRSFEKDVP